MCLVSELNFAVQRFSTQKLITLETLRKWPPAGVADRKCVRPYTIQPENANEEPIHLPTNSLVWLPIYAIHRDAKYFPDPEKFDPERFSDDNKHKVEPFTYLPFGMGPRNCIGNIFRRLKVTKTSS